MTGRRDEWFGLVNVDKPAGLTSRKVVDVVQRLVRPAKAGHAGTLDPMATGVLVVCVGPATRLIPLVQAQRKVYRAEFLFGRRSDTDDVTGQVEEVPGAESVPRERLEGELPRFVGRIEQVPPQFSAVHVGGQRAYDLARKGRTVAIEAKTVEVHRIDLLEYEWPRCVTEIECGSGTYIRSIGRDLGEALGCGAVMSALERTRIGPFRVGEAITPDQLDTDSLRRHLLSPALAATDLPTYRADAAECERLRQGQTLHGVAGLGEHDAEPVAVHTADGRLACLARYRHRDRSLAPKQVFG